jgi:hypothetical protein
LGGNVQTVIMEVGEMGGTFNNKDSSRNQKSGSSVGKSVASQESNNIRNHGKQVGQDEPDNTGHAGLQSEDTHINELSKPSRLNVLGEPNKLNDPSNPHTHIKRAGETYSFAADGFGQQAINGTIADDTSSLFIGGVKVEGNAFAVTYDNGTIIDNKFGLLKDGPPVYILNNSGSDLKISFNNTVTPTDQITITDFTDGDFGIKTVPGGAEFLVSNTYNSLNNPSVASLNNGGFVITWRNIDTTANVGVYAQRYDSDDNAVGVEFKVNTFSLSPPTTVGQWFPSVSSLNNGGFVIAWESYKVSVGVRIHAQRYAANGNIAGGEFLVSTIAEEAQNKPSVTSLVDGDFVIVWFGRESSPPRFELYGFHLHKGTRSTTRIF